MIARWLTRPVELFACGRNWRLLVTHRVLLKIAELTGQDAMAMNLARPSARVLRAVLFAVLREAGATISLEEAGAMMRPGAVPGIRAVLIEAWQASMPDPEPEGPASKQSTEPRLTMLGAWAVARYDLRLTDKEWLSMTPRMLRALSHQHLENIRWSELMMGVLCAHTVNHSFCAPKKPTSPRSYMLHPWPETHQPPQRVYGETLIGIVADAPKKRKAK
jgi:hypothetical protein